MKTEEITHIYDIEGCERCLDNHEKLAVNKFVRGPMGFTHWATCPATGDPILIKIGPERS